MSQSPTVPPKKLYKKLVEVLAEVGSVKKSGMNTHQSYAYMTEKDLVDSLRQELAKRGIFIFTSVENVERDKETHVTTVITQHTFWDEETEEHFTVQGAGQGYDKQDKGIYKAQTGAMKYFLMKNFLISSDDDPENEGAKKPVSSASIPAAKPATNTFSQFATKPASSVPKTELKVETAKVEPAKQATDVAKLLNQTAAPVAQPVAAPVATAQPKPIKSFSERFKQS